MQVVFQDAVTGSVCVGSVSSHSTLHISETQGTCDGVFPASLPTGNTPTRDSECGCGTLPHASPGCAFSFVFFCSKVVECVRIMACMV